ncbi:MAG: sulfotransferase [Gemmataceae bacterium]
MTPSRLPTFIIGGAPRSGTTYLAEALARHPDVYMARPFIPEPKVFMGPRQPSAVYAERYRALFAPANGHRLLGEKTSYYLENPDLCGAIRAVAPEVKLVFIVREPVARAYSNYLWSTKNGLEKLSFEEALEREGERANPLPEEKAYARPFDYIIRGDYAELAQPYFDAFGRDCVRFFLFEDIALRPEALMRSLQAFIGAEPMPFQQLDVGVVNSAKDVGPPIDRGVEQRLRERLRPAVERFAMLTGLDIAAWGY